MVWFGWDDRVSNGFCGHCNVEANLGFAALAIRATVDFAAVLKHAGQVQLASNYTQTAARLAKQLRSRPSTTGRGSEWYDDYGVHAASYLINAKIVATPAEEEAMFKKVLNNSVTICSWSPFNQVRKRHCLRCHCILKMIILPRQARDKHRGKLKK